MKNKSNEMVVKDPDPDYIRDIILKGAETLRDVRKHSASRHINPAQCVELAGEVSGTDYGCRVLDGGAEASTYPAHTDCMVVAWHTRLSGVKIVRTVLLIMEVNHNDVKCYAIAKAAIGAPLFALGDKAGPLVCSSILRELWEYSDIPCGDGTDSPRAAIFADPSDMRAWANFALVLDIGGADLNSRSPDAPAGVAEAIRQRVL